MALDLSTADTQTDEPTLGPDFYQGLNVLGKPTSVSLVGQEAGPPGQTLAAGGAPTAPASATSSPTAAPGTGGPQTSLAQEILSVLGPGAGIAKKIQKLSEYFKGDGSALATGLESNPELMKQVQDFLAGGTGTGGITADTLAQGLSVGGLDVSGLGASPFGGDVLTGADASLATAAEQGAVAGGTDVLGAAASALPYAGAALPAIASFAQGGPKTSTDIANLGVDTAAAAAAPFTFGASEAASGIARGIEDILGGVPAWKTALDFGGLGMVSGLFDKPGSYIPKRKEAGATAVTDLTSLGATLQKSAEAFAQSRDPAVALEGLQAQFGARNPVRSWLLLPNDLAAQVTGQPASGNYGANSQVEWAGMTPAQFTILLDAFKANPALLQSAVQGSGDVGYLPKAEAEAVAANAATQGREYLQFLLSSSTPPPAPPASSTPLPGASPSTTPAPGPAGGQLFDLGQGT